MKILLLILSLILVFATDLTFGNKREPAVQKTDYTKPRNEVAVILTGSAACIPQEAALLEEQDR